MLRSLLLLGVYFAFLGGGIIAPFILTLGYVWVDTFRPQEVAYLFLNQFPVAMVMGAAAIGAYLVMDRKYPPRFSVLAALQLGMAVWITLTTSWAEVPDAAWLKWDWASKTILFSAFVPLVIRSRVQIEAYVQTYLFALAANIIPFGLKTLISGGGYGRNLGLLEGNSGLAEGGYLSTLCLMAVPFALALGRHTLLLPSGKLTRVAYFGLAGLAMVTAIGTFERSALVGLVVLGGLHVHPVTPEAGVCLDGDSGGWRSELRRVRQVGRADVDRQGIQPGKLRPDTVACLEMDAGLRGKTSVRRWIRCLSDQPH